MKWRYMADWSTSTPILRVDNLAVNYGLVRGIAGVSFELHDGSAIAILGPNGAGKSTIARALAGLVSAAAGRIWFKDRDITSLSADRRRRLGIAYLPEERGIFPGLTVSENLRLAVRLLPTRLERRQGILKAFETFPGLAGRESQRANTLSGGEQQMLALGRIVCINPSLVVADEMSLGLAPRPIEVIFSALRRLRESGVAVVLIEQLVDRALRFSDDCLIMRNGSTEWIGRVVDLDEDVFSHYVGSGAE